MSNRNNKATRCPHLELFAKLGCVSSSEMGSWETNKYKIGTFKVSEIDDAGF